MYLCYAELVSMCCCRMAVSGPVVPDSRQPPLYKVAALPGGETLEWRLRFRLTGFGPITVQPLLTLPARSMVLPGECGFHFTPPLGSCLPAFCYCCSRMHWRAGAQASACAPFGSLYCCVCAARV